MVTLVTAFERQDMLDQNTKNLTGKVIIMDDHSQPPLRSSHEIIYAKKNHGKQEYWEWINVALDRLKDTKGDVLFIADDITVKPGGIEYAQSLLDGIRGHGLVAINLLKDNRIQCWTKTRRKVYNNNLYTSGFVDGCFICDRQVLELIDYKINQIHKSRWARNPNLGSGVWQQFTSRCEAFGVRFFQDRSGAFKHGNHESKMNAEIRKREPLI